MMLDREYAETLKTVSEARAGDEGTKWQLQKLAELHKQRMNEEQSERESYIQGEELDMKRKQNEQELNLKKEQIQEGKCDRVVKIVLDGVAIVAPFAVSSYWMGKGLKFEETGSFTSRVGNWVSGHLRLFKK
ncbi:MAG: hypothetical protein RSD95_08540 [Clostridia bacterium]